MTAKIELLSTRSNAQGIAWSREAIHEEYQRITQILQAGGQPFLRDANGSPTIRAIQLVEEGEDLICIAEIDIPDSLPYGGCGSFSLEGGRDA